MSKLLRNDDGELDMRGEITKSAQERALRSFLDLAILQRLNKNP